MYKTLNTKLSMQTTSHILMIRPVNFAYNAETAVNNAFQQDSQEQDIQQKALNEFNNFVSLLQENLIDVLVVEDTPEPYTPDSIFPNNWISFHENGFIILYPMFAENRRLERKQTVIDAVKTKFNLLHAVDYTKYEIEENIFLEGTGSMVFDRDNAIVYACISPRTNEKLLNKFCTDTDYHPIIFHATDKNNRLIYHTNVMMCMAEEYTVICLDSIKNENEKGELLTTFEQTEKEVIEISLEQMEHFAGNMLQVHNVNNEKFLIMSSQAYNSLTPEQIEALEKYNKILHTGLHTIETIGGGGARCMMAEIFLPLKESAVD
jgi:hypothetical protein